MPYLLDIQHDLLSDLSTRVVVPLIRARAFGRRASRLHPAFTIGGQEVVMATHLIAAIGKGGLGTSAGTPADRRDEILAAVDILWSGV
ncbi:MAG: CcdB family protein [Acetobacteraceae bacterium]|nr:CcdB family protein [Acetobacteraceae bacterium]